MKRRGLTPIERALIVRDWRSASIEGRIHALIGQDSAKLVNGAGRIAYVVLGAAAAASLSPDMTELRILRGAVNAIHEQAEEAVIDETRRASIIAGLEACERLLPLVTQRALAESALELHARLAQQDVRYSDFVRLIERKAA
jgi:hypothetical protein